MSYGQDYFISESQAKEIRDASDDIQKEEKRKRLTIHRTIEDHQMCKGFGITDKELNHRRVG